MKIPSTMLRRISNATETEEDLLRWLLKIFLCDYMIGGLAQKAIIITPLGKKCPWNGALGTWLFYIKLNRLNFCCFSRTRTFCWKTSLKINASFEHVSSDIPSYFHIINKQTWLSNGLWTESMWRFRCPCCAACIVYNYTFFIYISALIFKENEPKRKNVK